MKLERNIKLTVAFEGTAYHGWQSQSNLPTLQGLLSESLARITGEQVTLTGSGRTDAGTHARGLVANFLTASRIPPHSLSGL
jgi:tRNA pseudouridine38-40 synthase